MKFNISIAIQMDQTLKEKGIDRQLKLSDPNFCFFSLEQISIIDELTLTSTFDVSGIEQLKNLKKLIIKSPDFSHISMDIDIEDSNINQIKDFSFINCLTSLEELEIVNDINIKELDISELSNLKRLVVANNPNLDTLSGLETKKKLEEVMIYGNNITGEFDIFEYIENTFKTKRNILDISMYHSIIRKNPIVAKILTTTELVGKTKLKFAERTGFLDYSLISPQNLEAMYLKLDKLFAKNGLYEKDTLEKIAYVYKYVKTRLTFDKEGLIEREKSYKELMSQYHKVPEYSKKNFTSFHNSYVSYYLKKANCEGYVNLMRFMLSMLDVNSFNVHCRDKRSTNIAPNHSILRVQSNNEWFYCNPKYNPEDPKECFMGKLEDLEQDYDFNIYERLISRGENYGQPVEKFTYKRAR